MENFLTTTNDWNPLSTTAKSSILDVGKNSGNASPYPWSYLFQKMLTNKNFWKGSAKLKGYSTRINPFHAIGLFLDAFRGHGNKTVTWSRLKLKLLSQNLKSLDWLQQDDIIGFYLVTSNIRITWGWNHFCLPNLRNFYKKYSLLHLSNSYTELIRQKANFDAWPHNLE